VSTTLGAAFLTAGLVRFVFTFLLAFLAVLPGLAALLLSFLRLALAATLFVLALVLFLSPLVALLALCPLELTVRTALLFLGGVAAAPLATFVAAELFPLACLLPVLLAGLLTPLLLTGLLLTSLLEADLLLLALPVLGSAALALEAFLLALLPATDPGLLPALLDHVFALLPGVLLGRLAAGLLGRLSGLLLVSLTTGLVTLLLGRPNSAVTGLLLSLLLSLRPFLLLTGSLLTLPGLRLASRRGLLGCPLALLLSGLLLTLLPALLGLLLAFRLLGSLELAVWPALLFLGGVTAAPLAPLLSTERLVLLALVLAVFCSPLVVTVGVLVFVRHGEEYGGTLGFAGGHRRTTVWVGLPATGMKPDYCLGE